MATGWLKLQFVFSIYTVQLERFQLLIHLTSAVCLCGASIGIIFTLHLLFEENLLFSIFSRKLALFACKTSHSEARHGDCGDCNLPARTVIWLHVVLAVDCDVKGTSARCVSPVLPLNPERLAECWQKEGMAQVPYSYLVFLLRTHTPAHSSETRASHMPLVVLAEFSFRFLETANSAMVRSSTPLLPRSMARPLPRLAVHFPLACLSETYYYYHGIQPTCKWAEGENALTKHVPAKSLASRLHAPIETQHLKAALHHWLSCTECVCLSTCWVDCCSLSRILGYTCPTSSPPFREKMNLWSPYTTDVTSRSALKNERWTPCIQNNITSRFKSGHLHPVRD